MREYRLDDPVLNRIARIIDEADTVQEVRVEPAAPGLDLICEGIRLTSTDDDTALERGALVYDALGHARAGRGQRPAVQRLQRSPRSRGYLAGAATGGLRRVRARLLRRLHEPEAGVREQVRSVHRLE